MLLKVELEIEFRVEELECALPGVGTRLRADAAWRSSHRDPGYVAALGKSLISRRRRYADEVHTGAGIRTGNRSFKPLSSRDSPDRSAFRQAMS